ncbi:hypothetical protein E2562_036536 [Oryza meyeriana var. granulata]|uniref:Uncharacterized protein n=1 Tax=Oryza meyeriana var. granulata TaxID=110450 RepID=A0A6G1DTR5_9ORYZ|nr:hypothetical protein E2562_036536 [Oryza meyeriana var. granulata]
MLLSAAPTFLVPAPTAPSWQWPSPQPSTARPPLAPEPLDSYQKMLYVQAPPFRSTRSCRRAWSSVDDGDADTVSSASRCGGVVGRIVPQHRREQRGVRLGPRHAAGR